MDERAISVGGVVASVCLNAVVGAYTETAALLAATPAGILIYLLVGIGIPQSVIYRQHGSADALGVSVVIGVLSGLVLVAGLLDAGLSSDWGGGFVSLLLVAVLGVLLTASVRAFAQGYQG